MAKGGKKGQTRSQFNSVSKEAAMGHAQMLKIRRAKQRTKKQLAGIAKRAKKLRGQAVKTVADAAKKASS